MSAKQRIRRSKLGDKVKRTAWKQIKEHGASSLSLRAIARDLNVTAPAIYNYFRRRDDLVTAMIGDAFDSFGTALKNALKDIPPSAHSKRLRALGLAYRQWALDHPQRYQLIFGTPIPGYVAPEAMTGPAAAEALNVLVSVLQAAHISSVLKTTSLPPMGASVEGMLKRWQMDRAEDADLEVLYLAHIIWCRAHGQVSLEIGNQFPPFIDNPGAIFRRDLESLIQEFFTG